jgi:2-oxoglutarate dehydrogenase E2 component (dihydrolipoamide succinyltransferase)
MRKSIAAHMVESKHTSPHVLTVMEADMSRVSKHRAANKAAFEKDGVNLTFTAYFMTAIVAGLKAYPMVNSSWSDEGVLIHKAINIGMATSLAEEGLIVPVIKGADNHSLLAMARSVNDLANRARNKKLQPDEVKGGTFTLTNHGISGSLFAFPVINQPQCGILGVGAMQKRVIVIPAEGGTRDDAIAIRPMVYLSFVFDHRILDGASADWFLAKVKETLENWT